MRWTTIATFFSFFCLVVSQAEDGAPYLHVMARSSVFNAGEKKAIYCKGLNLPQRIEWLSPSGKIVEGRSTKNTRVYVEKPKDKAADGSLVLVPLIIHSTKLEDSGNWTCQAGELSETIEILVGEKVNMSIRYESFEGEEGKSARLDCVAKGNPAPGVQWYKDAVPISNNSKKYVMRKKEDNHQLEIKNLNHRDTGEYVCKVTQKDLSYYTDKRVQLTVRHKPLLINPITEEIIATARTEEVYAILNETKNITCRAIGNPPPIYRWYRVHNSYDDELPINDEETVIHSEDGTSSVLVLRMYNTSFLGEYKCSANNSKGHVYIVFDVSLGNKPNPPDAVNLVSAEASTLTFNVTCFTCNMDGGDDIKAPDPANLTVLGYSFELVPVQPGFPPDWDAATEYQDNVEFANDTLFTVGPLANSTEFHARVRTRNAAGFSEWVLITPNPITSHTTQLVASIIITITAMMFICCY